MFLCVSQELQYVEDEQHRTKSSLQTRIKDREDEIQKLRNQVTDYPQIHTLSDNTLTIQTHSHLEVARMHVDMCVDTQQNIITSV